MNKEKIRCQHCGAKLREDRKITVFIVYKPNTAFCGVQVFCDLDCLRAHSQTLDSFIDEHGLEFKTIRETYLSNAIHEISNEFYTMIREK